jgi:hypothetical protein
MTPEKQARWLDKVSKAIMDTCEMINRYYGNDPVKPFEIACKADGGKLTPATVYLVLRHFPRIGPKKATMIAREWAYYGFPSWLQERIGVQRAQLKHFSEVPLDVHVKKRFSKIFKGTRLTAGNPQDVQNVARVVFPDCPGLLDKVLWKRAE